ncbi:hypothetical protein TWF694_009821 [Orbilia ellipsospora]|uniref:MYND-type domain-containing protein n=1 Tax=Orbilia ellipsospora TaxID=2528407 RepID=A0AAV9XC15_9PEZI
MTLRPPQMMLAGLPPDDTNVLVLSFASETEKQVCEYRHGDLLQHIKDTFGMTVKTNPDDALSHINIHAPTFILVVDSGFAQQRYRWFQDHVFRAVRAGACLILCCEFPRTVNTDDFQRMLFNASNLRWEVGLFRVGTYSLHNICDILTGIHHAPGVEHDFEMRAIELYDLNDKSRLFIDKDLDLTKDKTKNSAAVAVEKTENGYICYIGDAGTQPVLRNVLSYLMAKANIKYSKGHVHNQPRHKQRRGGQSQPAFLHAPFIQQGNNPAISRNSPRRIPRGGPCDNCGKPNTTRTCYSCQTVFYCNGECQSIGLRKHKDVCPAQTVSLEAAIQMAREGNPTPLVKELIFKQDRREVSPFPVTTSTVNQDTNPPGLRAPHRYLPCPCRGSPPYLRHQRRLLQAN